MSEIIHAELSAMAMGPEITDSALDATTTVPQVATPPSEVMTLADSTVASSSAASEEVRMAACTAIKMS